MAYITRAELLEQVKELKAMVAALEENLKKSDKIISLQEEIIAHQDVHIEILQKTINELVGEEVYEVEDYKVC